MPRFADDDEQFGGAFSVETRPGIWESLRSYVEWEYARSGDPRDRMMRHEHGQGGVCSRGCYQPSGDPEHRAVRMLADYDAGQPIVVPHHIASGQRWTGNGWSEPEFELPWDAKDVRHVLVDADGTVRPA